ncbi:MAG: formate/nitrite transporter family protein [Candidatus Aenigmarchaeota archaeon]|nr:formate/nitrite transporter family protein [Candidatus Aenigmarchaeota archaeon]
MFFKLNQERMAFKKPDEIAEQVVEIGIKKANLPLGKMFALAFLAGVFIAFGAELSTIVSYDLGNFSVGFSRFLAGSVFSFGLMLVIITEAELFYRKYFDGNSFAREENWL